MSTVEVATVFTPMQAVAAIWNRIAHYQMFTDVLPCTPGEHAGHAGLSLTYATDQETRAIILPWSYGTGLIPCNYVVQEIAQSAMFSCRPVTYDEFAKTIPECVQAFHDIFIPALIILFNDCTDGTWSMVEQDYVMPDVYGGNPNSHAQYILKCKSDNILQYCALQLMLYPLGGGDPYPQNLVLPELTRAVGQASYTSGAELGRIAQAVEDISQMDADFSLNNGAASWSLRGNVRIDGPGSEP